MASTHDVKSTRFLHSPLRINFLLALSANCIYAATQWGIISVIAKTGTPEKLGLFGLGLAVAGPISAFTNLQLRGVYCSDAQDDHPFSDYISLRATGALITCITASLIAWISYDTPQTRNVIILISVAVGSQSLSDIFYAFYQKKGAFIAYAASKILKGILSVLLVTFFMVTTQNLFLAIVGLLIGQSAVIFLMDIPLVQKSGTPVTVILRSKARHLKQLFIMSLPMGVNMMILSFSVNIPRYVIESRLNKNLLGIFCAMVYVTMAGTMVMGALGDATLPRLASRYAQHDMKGFWRILGRLATAAAVLSAGGILLALCLGEEILTHIYTPEYSNYHGTFLIIVLASCVKFFSSIAGVAVTSTRAFKSFPFLNGVACIVSICSALVFIPKFGIQGGAISMLMTSSTGLILFSGLLFSLVRRHKPLQVC